MVTPREMGTFLEDAGEFKKITCTFSIEVCLLYQKMGILDLSPHLGRLEHVPKLFMQQILRKVPEVTIFFWIIKLFTTGMGETTSDYLAHQINPIIAVGIGGIGLGIALFLQFWVRKYIPWIYWLAVAMVAIFGTMAADVLHVGFGIPYVVSSIFFFITLIIIFIIWHKVEKTLSIHSITTRRRELFYWATVLATFALGTAVGDMTATTMHLGYVFSGILFAVLIMLPAIAFYFFHLNEILAFWIAYILTRPLGASFADWIGRAKDLGGLGLGTGQISVILSILIVLFVAYLSLTYKDTKIGHNTN